MTHARTDLAAFRDAVASALASGDPDAVLATIHPLSRAMAAEHGPEFREVITGLPTEIWHSDPQIAAHLGGSYRSVGSPRGHAALGYFVAAEGALAITPDAPIHCLASVLLGHGAALRTMGMLDQARAKVLAARDIISTQLAGLPIIRIRLGARFSLENGMLELETGNFASARSHLEYAHGLASTYLSRAEHIELLGAIAQIDAVNGELGQAAVQIGYARDLAAGTDLLQTGYGAPALVAELWIANERYDLPAALALEADVLEASSGNEWEPHALAVVAHTRALQSKPVEALDVAERALKGFSTWEGPAFGADFARLLRAALLLALDHADEAWEILKTLDPGENHALCPARVTAQLRMNHGDLVGADQAIQDCEALGELHCSRTVVDIQLVRAAIELARGNFTVSDVSADRAFVTLTRTGSRAVLGRISPSVLATLARRALERGHGPEVTEMLARIADRAVSESNEIEPLSARERDVLAQVQRGLTVAAIAAALYISPNTVKTHLRRLYRKLNVSTREEAIRAARSLGLDREITRDSPV